jgi:hypothetical protein
MKESYAVFIGVVERKISLHHQGGVAIQYSYSYSPLNHPEKRWTCQQNVK